MCQSYGTVGVGSSGGSHTCMARKDTDKEGHRGHGHEGFHWSVEDLLAYLMSMEHNGLQESISGRVDLVFWVSGLPDVRVPVSFALMKWKAKKSLSSSPGQSGLGVRGLRHVPAQRTTEGIGTARAPGQHANCSLEGSVTGESRNLEPRPPPHSTLKLKHTSRTHDSDWPAIASIAPPTL
jgi:hypothetical protein